jgi:hypothetical protein
MTDDVYFSSNDEFTNKAWLGRLLTKAEFVKLDPGKLFDDLTGNCDGDCATFYVDGDGVVGIVSNVHSYVLDDDGDNIADPYDQIVGVVS